MSRTPGLRQSVSCSLVSVISRGWYRGLVVALSGSGSEYRSLNGVDGLRPCLAPSLSTIEAARGQGRAGPASEYSESVVVVCCVLPQLRLGLRCWTRLRALAPAWSSVTGGSETQISVTAGPGPHWHHHSCDQLLLWHQDETSEASAPSPWSSETMRCGINTGLSCHGSITIRVSLRGRRSRRYSRVLALPAPDRS